MVLLIVGAVAVGALVYRAEPHYLRHYREQCVLLLLGYLRLQEGRSRLKDAYSERLAAKTYADQLFLGQQEFAHQFRENMYMAGIQGD